MGHPRTRTADMSDAPQGDDWWLASDSRWYPPSSMTGSQPPAPPPAPPGATNVLLAPALTGWLRGLMWAYVAVTVAMVAVGVAYWGAIEGLRRGDVALDDAIGVENAYRAVAGVQLVAWVSIFVLMIVWLAKAHTATTSLLAVPGARKYSRGWCIGVWFIPFANFISTPQVFAEHQRIADAARTDGWVKGDWKSLPSSRLIPWWDLHRRGDPPRPRRRDERRRGGGRHRCVLERHPSDRRHRRPCGRRHGVRRDLHRPRGREVGAPDRVTWPTSVQ